jgi:Mrp family chromosome partitioning ATPase
VKDVEGRDANPEQRGDKDMARIIEALRQADAQRTPLATAPSITAAPVEMDREAPDPEAMPYIEVGGKGKTVCASPEVLACPPVRVGPAAPQFVPMPETPGSYPLTVAFRPWPEQRPASRRMAPELLAYHQPEHPLSKQYGALLESLLADESGRSSQVLLLTAAAPGVGATTVLLNLAISACAGERRRTVVVDFNLHRPALAARLGLPLTPGLHEVLAGTVALEHALQPTAMPGLHALAATPGAWPTSPRTAEALRWLMGWLRERFDVVFLDGPPGADGPELAALTGLADAIYPVVSEAETGSAAVQHLLQAITRRGGRLRGLLHIQRAA